MSLFALGMLLWLVLFIGLFVLGIAGIVQTVRTPDAPQPPVATPGCAHCGQPILAGWKACPHCGEKI